MKKTLIKTGALLFSILFLSSACSGLPNSKKTEENLEKDWMDAETPSIKESYRNIFDSFLKILYLLKMFHLYNLEII